MNKTDLTEHKDHWTLGVVGREVTRCLIDYAFGIELWTHEDPVSIRIGGSFHFTSRAGDGIFSAEKGPTELGIVLSILHKEVESAIAYKNGLLSLKFSNNASLDVPPDEKYEAWEINSDAGIKLVCLPGGELAIWLARKDTSHGT